MTEWEESFGPTAYRVSWCFLTYKVFRTVGRGSLVRRKHRNQIQVPLANANCFGCRRRPGPLDADFQNVRISYASLNSRPPNPRISTHHSIMNSRCFSLTLFPFLFPFYSPPSFPPLFCPFPVLFLSSPPRSPFFCLMGVKIVVFALMGVNLGPHPPPLPP